MPATETVVDTAVPATDKTVHAEHAEARSSVASVFMAMRLEGGGAADESLAKKALGASSVGMRKGRRRSASSKGARTALRLPRHPRYCACAPTNTLSMDPLTHALLGAAGGFAVSRGRSRIAALAGFAGAMLPDADVLIGSSTDPLVSLEYHRQFTHSLLVAPFGAALAAVVIWLAMRQREPFKALYWPALAGYASAVLLDACTSYGTQLLWPFTQRRFAASVVAIVDPIVTLVLLVGVIAAFRAATAHAARVAVAIVMIYLGFGWLQRERAESAIERAAAARGQAIAAHQVKPTLGNLLLWRSVYLSGNDYVVDAVRVGFSVLLYPGGSARSVKPIDLVPPLTINSVQANDVVRFAKVSEGYLARDPARPNVIGDIRYSMVPNGTRPLWAIEIHPEIEEQHVVFHTFRQLTKPDRDLFFAMLRGVAPVSLAPASTRQRGAHAGAKRKDPR